MDPLSWIIVVLIVVVGIYSIVKLKLEHNLKSEKKTIDELEQKVKFLENKNLNPYQRSQNYSPQDNQTQPLYHQNNPGN